MFKIIKCLQPLQAKFLRIDLQPENVYSRVLYSSGNKNIAAVMYGPKDMRLEEFPLQKLQDDEVLAQIEVCGICGSDMHIFTKGQTGGVAIKSPFIIGHEASGTVVECGKTVTNLKVGDRVAIEPQYGCGKCEFCKTGHYNICPSLYHAGFPRNNGNLCKFMTFPSDICFRLPKNMDFDDGALIQPLSIAAYAIRRVGVRGGDTVCIMGAGAIGLTTFLCARYTGASRILMLDVDDFKLCKAKELGCEQVLNIKGISQEELVKKIHKILDRAPNKTIDCVGMDQTFTPCVLATRRGGRVGIVGMAKESISFPLMQTIVKELDIIGCFKIVNAYPLAIEMVSSGRTNLKPLITHKFKFEDTIKAFELIANQKEPFLKVLIQVNSSLKSNCLKC